MFCEPLDELIKSLSQLPGIGPKSAQRLAFYLLKEPNKPKGFSLADTLEKSLSSIQLCEKCRLYSDKALCRICQNSKRYSHQLCIVETPQDVFAIENTNSYRGRYFVLHGRLSPLDGIGPNDLGIDLLKKALSNPELNEVILATNATVEGQATAHYLSSLLRPGLACSQIAQGIPLGGELEYLDGGTLSLALQCRTHVTTTQPELETTT